MATMPNGQPRSVPDPAGDQYDEMVRTAWRTGFSPRDNQPDFGREQEGGDKYVKIDNQWYRSVDNGRANVLVVAGNPIFSPAERAQQRQAAERALFDSSYPLAGAASGLAALTGASPEARDAVRAVGALADTALSFGVARTPPAPRAASVGQAAPPPQVRQSVRHGQLNTKGQATGVNATLTAPMLGTGTRANQRLTPPGWSGNGNLYNEARGHLHGANLGGSGDDMPNLVTQTQKPMNSPWMRDFELSVARRVRDGEVVEYFAIPLYGSELPPTAIALTAHGSRDGTSAKIISNPAGRRK